ncbi:MAG: VF530 family protein [Bacteroidia bacterium]
MAEPTVKNPDPLHGKTLQMILEYLVDYYGWEMLGIKIPINCFRSDPSMSSSLKFLRRYPWARQQVEELYVEVIRREGNGSSGGEA